MTGKHTLLAVSGLSPQILTEALYALIMEGRPVDEVHVITTRQGKDAIHAQILASGQGAFFQLLREYGIPEGKIMFPPENIHVLKDAYGFELDDIRTTDDNDLLIEKCMELTWRLTMHPKDTVYFLIAGGRKTMSACLALAAQFYGRPQDRIYHVLVSSDFESSRDFFFPPKEPKDITTRDKNGRMITINTRYATIDLVPMPFVSVRQYLEYKDLREPRAPQDLLDGLICDMPQRLIINIDDMKIDFCKRELDFPPAQMALYARLASMRKDCSCQGEREVCKECFKKIDELAEDQERLKLFSILKCRSPFVAYAVKQEKGGTGTEIIRSYISKINRKIQKHFGARSSNEIKIHSMKIDGDTRYGLTIRPDRIEVKKGNLTI